MLKFTVDGLTTNTVVQGSVSVNDGLWHHVAGVYDGSELLLYIDGVEDNAVTATGTMDTNNVAAYIGANADVGGLNFNGSMNDVYIYDSVLTPSTIGNLAATTQLGWWKLDESSGTTAYDASGNSNNGTLQSMAGDEWTTGTVDGGLDFSGTNDYVDTNIASNAVTSITMTTWFKSDDAGSIGDGRAKHRFMSQHRNSTASRLAFGINNDRIAVYWRDGGGGNNTQEVTSTVIAGTWYHAAVTYDGTTVRLYVNGVEDGNWAESSLASASSDTFKIGCRYSTNKEFDGVLDDVRLYSRALCAAEIALIYQPPSNGLFTDVSGSVGFDVQSSDAVVSGAGLHWADFDNDGDLDAIVTGNNNARLYLSTNEGDSFFVTNFGGGNYPRQGAMLDIDNDGDIDFWHSGETFHENNGSASFSVIGDLGFSDPTGTESTAAADVNGDGYCDVLMFSANGNWFGTHEGSVTETLAGTNDAGDGLNDGGDYGAGGYCSSGDVNSDGYLDFFYHFGNGKLFLSNADGTYTENASGISVATSDTQEVGSAWGDYDNDGDLDLFVPRFASGSTGYLWRNDRGTFVDVTVAAGISDTSGHRGSCWGDFDNDGYLDLYVCVSSGANVLYRNQGDGTFSSVMEGAELGGTSQDAVFVDYDNDGDLDLAVTQESATNVLLRNGNNDKSYLKVRLIGHGASMTNKAAIGVRVDLYESNGTTFIARREIGVARGLGGTEPIWVHFGGLTKTTTYVVKAHFASGLVSTNVVPQSVSTTIGSVTILQMVTITERKPDVSVWAEVDPR